MKSITIFLKRLLQVIGDPEVGKWSRVLARLVGLWSSYNVLGITDKGLVVAQIAVEAIVRLMEAIGKAWSRKPS